MWRKLLVGILVATMVHAPEFPVTVMAESLPRTKDLQPEIERAGVGSYVELKLSDGRRLHGRLEAIEEEFFTVRLLQGEDTQIQVKYEQVAKLKVLKRTSYRAEGPPNAALARQAIEGLGVGTHVMVKLRRQTILRGHIQAIDERNFTLRLDAGGELTPISYDQVLQVHENFHVQIIITAWVAVIGAVVGIVVYLVTRKSGPEPLVSNIDPKTVQAGQSVNVRITGNNFAAGATVTFKNGDGPAPMASNVVVADANTITATVAVNFGGPSHNRAWDVVVTNPGGKTTRVKGGFTVIP